MNPGDFPVTPRMENVDLFEIDAAALRRMIERTVMVGSSQDDKRAHMAGVYFEKVPGKILRMVATDGSRLSKVDHVLQQEAGPEMENGVLIPKKGLSELGKFLESDGSVRMGIQDNHFVVRRESETLVIRLLEGGFPDYREIFKNESVHLLKFDRQAFLMMMKRMSILSSEDYKGVVFHFSDERFVVSTTNPDLGESREETATDFRGESMEIAFNPRYFIDTLNAIETDSVVLQLIDEKKPCMIEGEDDKSFVSVIMPMKI
jgi:DNA polymerase III subunit beta